MHPQSCGLLSHRCVPTGVWGPWVARGSLGPISASPDARPQHSAVTVGSFCWTSPALEHLLFLPFASVSFFFY